MPSDITATDIISGDTLADSSANVQSGKNVVAHVLLGNLTENTNYRIFAVAVDRALNPNTGNVHMFQNGGDIKTLLPAPFVGNADSMINKYTSCGVWFSDSDHTSSTNQGDYCASKYRLSSNSGFSTNNSTNK